MAQCGDPERLPLVGVAERFLKKGSKIYVEGQLKTRKWQDQSGNDRYSTEVVIGFGGVLTMLDGAKGSQGGQGDTGGGSSRGRDEPASQGGFADDLDDEIPF